MTTQTNISLRAWIELLLLGTFWGGTFLTMRIALDEIDFFTAVLHRVGWATLILWAVVLIWHIPRPETRRIWAALIVMGALNNVIPFSLQAWAQLYIESGLTAIYNSATAVVGVLLAALFFVDEKLTTRKITGIAIGFLGTCVVIGVDALRNFDLRSMAQLAVILSTVSYAFAAVWARHNLKGLHPVMAATGMLTGSTLIMLPLTLTIEGVPSLALAPITWASIAYYALFATVFAYLLYYRVLAMAGAGNLMLVTLLVPPFAIVLGTIFLDETLPQRAYGGFALLAVGLLIIDGRILRLFR